MEPNRQHSGQQCRGCMDVRNPSLARPGPESGDFPSLPYGDRQVLMPGEIPVGGQGLVEEDSTYGECSRAENCLGDVHQLARPRQSANLNAPPEQVAAPINLAAT